MDVIYRPRHARHANPAELPVILRGLADLITVIEDTREDN
jgi:hypothetical protein